MKFSELTQSKGIKSESRGSLLTFKSGEHYSDFLGNIIFMPTTKAQATKQIKALREHSGGNLLMCGQWFPIEEFLNKHGFEGDYKLSKSGSMCRLLNQDDLAKAIALEFKDN